MKKILRYDYEGLPAINSQAPLWYASLHENQDMAPEYAKRLTTEDEVADGWTSRVYWITMLYGYVPQTRRTQGTIVSSVSFFTIGRLRVLHPYHTHHLGPLLGGQSSERRWIYTHNVNLRSSAYPTIGPYPWAKEVHLPPKKVAFEPGPNTIYSRYQIGGGSGYRNTFAEQKQH